MEMQGFKFTKRGFTGTHKVILYVQSEVVTMVGKEEVMEVLRNCYDPEIPINIVDLGLVYGVEVDGDRAHIKMTLTAPGCPMHAMIAENVKQKVESLEGINRVVVEMVWDPPWTPERLSEAAKKQMGVK